MLDVVIISGWLGLMVALWVMWALAGRRK